MFTVDTVFGRPMSFWHELDFIMCKYGIENSKQLRERLEPHKRTSIYDSRNNDRLLGTLPKPDMCAPYMKMPTVCSASVYEPRYAEMEMTVSTATFEVGVKRGPNPLDVRGVLHTSDPLSTLMKVRDFRLPGESEEQAERRRYDY